MRAKAPDMRVWAVAAASALLTAASPPAAPPPDLKLFAADEAVSMVSMAPDGRTVAFLETTPEGRRIDLLPAGSGGPTRVNTGPLVLGALDWIDSDHLLILHRQELSVPNILPRQLVTQGISFNIKTGHAAEILGGAKDVAPIFAGGPVNIGSAGANSALYIRGLVAGPAFNLFRIDPESGRGSRMSQDTFDGDEWMVSADGQILAEVNHRSSQHPRELLLKVGDTWRAVDVGERPYHIVGLGRAPGMVLLSLDDDLREAGPDAKLGASLQPVPGVKWTPHPDRVTQRLIAISPPDAGRDPIFFDRNLELAWAKAVRAFPGKRVALRDYSADFTQLVVSAAPAAAAPAFYWVDLKTGRAELIADSAPQLAGVALAQARPLSFAASDGVSVQARLLLPPGTAGRGLPVVVTAHGFSGPGGGSGFTPVLQVLASRGYAVLEVDVHGSPQNPTARLGQLGRRQQTDMSEALAALARDGVVDARRACILGEGLGGYAALAGVTVQHDFYRCAIAIHPVADLRQRGAAPEAFMRGSAWERAATLRQELGADASDPGLAAVSPLDHAAQGDAPVLLVQGPAEKPEPPQEVERMRAALAAAHRRVEILALDGGARQDLRTPEGREALYTAMLAFLAKYNPV